MKRSKMMHIFLAAIFALFLLNTNAWSQDKKPRPSPKAMSAHSIGLDGKITVKYSRPGVKGRTIWGELVPYGMAEGNKYSDNKPYPWRAGANENTTIEFNKDVTVNGEALAAGKYGIHMIPTENDGWTIIFSNNNAIWGSYAYNQEEDALRITVKPQTAEHQEWLLYNFDNYTGNSTDVYMHWEKLKVAFTVTVVTN